MLDFIKKIFPDKHKKDVEKIRPIVTEINNYYEEYHKLSDEELRAKSDEFKVLVKDTVKDLEQEKKGKLDILKNEELDADKSFFLKEEIKKLDQEIYETINEKLTEILPEAYAIIKQVCKRLTDRRFHYEYTDTSAIWEMVPYDVQLIGGVVLHNGRIAEMATGEGKTLVSVLPIYLNALAGKGVHVVTVNDYLARRDCEWMKPVFDFVGISVGALQSSIQNDERQRIYRLDVTYGTNSEFGFDYLRDNMVVEEEQIVQRPHWYAIVDEVDSVLIDEARTPLIISGPVGETDQKFDIMNPRVRRLVEVQTQLINRLTAEVERLVQSDKKEDRDEAGIALLRCHRGLPKHKRLRKLLQEGSNLKLLQETELFFLRDKGKRMPEIDEELFYVIEEKQHQIDIMDKGRNLLATAQEDADMFLIPDMPTILSAIEGDASLSETEKQRRKDDAHRLFAERSDVIHTVTSLLRAYSLYERDVEYVVADGKVQIVDEFTGRILEGRRYSEGLHQAIEAKEGVKVQRDTQTLATITLQNYFRLYKKLGGMTGTADTEAAEFDKIYNLDVTVIPTNKPIVRDDQNDLIFRTTREKYNAMVEEIRNLLEQGRAVLVGTASVDVSEILSKMLTRARIKHNVLNAKQHQREAEIIAHAGRKGSVTIATNMAGRGTDIKLDPEVKTNGGLAIIGSERHEARRIDRQLRGRAGRQGDPGSSIFFISLEDKLMRLFAAERIAKLMNTFKMPEGEPITHQMITKTVENAQKKVEENNFGIRKHLIEYDDVMNMQRELIYVKRRSALRGDRLKADLFDYIYDIAAGWFEQYHEKKDLKGLKNQVRSVLLCEIDISEQEFDGAKEADVVEKIVKAAEDFYSRKEQMLGKEYMTHLEKYAVLQTIDDKWKEHLRMMDEIKEGINLRAYGQKDPLLEYKGEAVEQFRTLLEEIALSSVSIAFKYFPQMQPKEVQMKAAELNIPKVRAKSLDHGITMGRDESTTEFVSRAGAPRAQEQESNRSSVATFRRTEDKVGRNDPCPCGSGKKYKNCHGSANLN